MSDTITESPAKKAAKKADRKACVGLPVQFHNGSEVLPAFLQRQSITSPDLWDVKVSLSGAGTLVTRSAVKHSEEPAPGCWSYLPV